MKDRNIYRLERTGIVGDISSHWEVKFIATLPVINDRQLHTHLSLFQHSPGEDSPILSFIASVNRVYKRSNVLCFHIIWHPMFVYGSYMCIYRIDVFLANNPLKNLARENVFDLVKQVVMGSLCNAIGEKLSIYVLVEMHMISSMVILVSFLYVWLLCTLKNNL